jgi:FkbM family methyltransferase
MSARGAIENGDLRVRPCRYGLMLYSRHDVYIGRAFEHYGEYSEHEVALFRQLVARGDTVIDAGANIGSHTVFFAGQVAPSGRVHAFEPQRIVYHMLCANLALNALGNVYSYRAGLGQPHAGDPVSGPVLKVPPVNYGAAGNFGGVALTGDGAGEPTPVLAIDDLDLPACRLIKIDVQGMEAEVIRGGRETIRRHRPVLYVENDLREKSAALIGALFELDYRLYWHLPPLFNADNYLQETQNIYPNIRSINMLCLPPGDPRTIDLRAIRSSDDWWRDGP